MAIECAYSFKDLYRAAYKRDPKKSELEFLYSFPQGKKNEKVREWAALAHWEVRERQGEDGVVYLAFAPSFSGDGADVMSCDVALLAE